MIRIDMICQDTRHPDKRRRHQGRANCEVAGRRFETLGPAPIYRIATLLWLHGHGGATFEVWDDVSPFGKLGGQRALSPGRQSGRAGNTGLYEEIARGWPTAIVVKKGASDSV